MRLLFSVLLLFCAKVRSSDLTFSAIPTVTAGAAAQAPSRPGPTVRPAIDTIFAAFEKHPLVGMGDMHGMAQQEDFFVTLIRDPRFAKEVGNVVVEFGTATHQDILDRYINGGSVSYAELRSVWSDGVGGVPTITGLGYANFFVQVRSINLSLPPDRRIRVWLGEPVMEWSKVKTLADINPVMAQRDSYPAAIIKREILAKGKKALVIYGSGHFNMMPDIPEEFGIRGLQNLVEDEYPHAFFVVMPYGGFVEKACSVAFEQTYGNWPTPALAFPVRGSSIEDALRKPGCHAAPPMPPIRMPNKTEAESAKISAKYAVVMENVFSGMNGDALLY